MSQETKHATLEWRGDLHFEGGAPGEPTTLVDGSNAQAPGPMLHLLLAAASCSAADVVVILKKMQTTLETLRVEVAGVRREQEPRRYVSIHLVYHIAGAGIDEAKARRAIDLSIGKYCSVMHSLAPDVRITYDLRV